MQRKNSPSIFFLAFYLLLIIFIVIQSYSFIENDHYFRLYSNFIVYGEETTTRVDNKSSSNISNIDDFTLLVYMIASNLEEGATIDIDEMLQSNLTNSNTNVLVQIGGGETKYKNKIQRYEIFEDQEKITNINKTNMADSEALSDFIKWGISNYTAKKYGLILWDHGRAINGFGLDSNYKTDHNDNDGDALHLSEIKSLKDTLIPDLNLTNLEFIGFDSCLMSTIEVANVLGSDTPLSKYLIASEEIEPAWGWDYRTIIDSISSNQSISGELLGNDIIDSYVEHSKQKSEELQFHADRDITLSIIDLTKITNLNKKMDDITTKLIDNEIYSNYSFIKLLKVVDNTEKFGQGASSNYTANDDFGMIDIFDFLNNLGTSFPSLKLDADSIKNEINSTIVIKNYVNKSHPNSKGISIYLPISKEQFNKMNIKDHDTGTKIPVILYSEMWTNLIDIIKNRLNQTINSQPILKTAKINNSIYFHILKPDIKNIFVEISLNSTKGKPIVYYQKLDPLEIDKNGYFKYDTNKIFELCNESENICIPASVNQDITNNLTKFFINVQIKKEGKSERKSSSLIYDFQDGQFTFLGGVDQINVKSGIGKKEKINIEKGDLVYTQGFADSRIINQSSKSSRNRSC